LNHDLGQEISNKAMNTTLYYYSQGDGTKENLIHNDTIGFHMGRDFKQKAEYQPIADIESIHRLKNFVILAGFDVDPSLYET
jgi:hypothetical protein